MFECFNEGNFYVVIILFLWKKTIWDKCHCSKQSISVWIYLNRLVWCLSRVLWRVLLIMAHLLGRKYMYFCKLDSVQGFVWYFWWTSFSYKTSLFLKYLHFILHIHIYYIFPKLVLLFLIKWNTLGWADLHRFYDDIKYNWLGLGQNIDTGI